MRIGSNAIKQCIFKGPKLGRKIFNFLGSIPLDLAGLTRISPGRLLLRSTQSRGTTSEGEAQIGVASLLGYRATEQPLHQPGYLVGAG